VTDENYTAVDFEEDEEYEEEGSVIDILYEALSPKIKQFLREYYGKQLYNLQPETYLEINKTIREGFIFASEIPDILYRNRTISDPEAFDNALAKYILPKMTIVWPRHEYWFDHEFGTDDYDDEDTFLEDSRPIDLTEDEIKAKNIITLANEITDHTQRMAHFVKTGYEIILKEAQLFLERRAIFDLAILSPEGFDKLHDQLTLLIETILEELQALIDGDLMATKNN
jgi:hypothetical protein